MIHDSDSGIRKILEKDLTPVSINIEQWTRHRAPTDRITGLKVAGPTGRFKRSLLKKVHLSGGESALADEEVGAVLRQCLWQWGYELTGSEYQNAMRGDQAK